MTKNKQSLYSQAGLWSLFFSCAFLLHAWALTIAFGDISWVSQRTNLGDAIGVISYGAVFTFIESGVFFLGMLLLGFLLPRQWPEPRRIALLSAFALILSLWGILGQLYFLINQPLPDGLILFLARSGHPVRLIYSLLTPLVLATFLIPAYLALKNRNFTTTIEALIERISVPTGFFLFLDIAGLLVILSRNIF